MSVYLGLGSNLGNREANLRAAVRMLQRQSEVLRVSALYRSAAVVLEGEPPGPDFLNAVCEIATSLSPAELLAFVKEIEHEIGRRPAGKWASRPIDIDILLYNDEVIETETLTIPHPLMHDRPFVLLPLAEIVPADLKHPGTGVSLAAAARDTDAEAIARIDAQAWP